MTVHRRGIEKYLEPAMKLANDYNLDEYYINRLNLVKEEIEDIFPKTKKPEKKHNGKQFNLTDFMRLRK